MLHGYFEKVFMLNRSNDREDAEPSTASLVSTPERDACLIYFILIVLTNYLV